MRIPAMQVQQHMQRQWYGAAGACPHTTTPARCSHRRAGLHVMARSAGFGKPATTVPRDLQLPRSTPVVSKLEWQSPLRIIKYPDPRLRAVNARVAVFDDSLLALAKEMIAVMYQDDGVGLAAPQVGVNVRLMVFNPEGRAAPGNDTILVNPEIINLAGPRGLGEEGCLSFPGIYGNVERARDLVIRAQNEKGESVQMTLGGEALEAAWVSRIFQHEYDHLQGILFHDRMRPAVLDKVRPQLVALEEAFLQSNPGVKVKRLEPAKVHKGF